MSVQVEQVISAIKGRGQTMTIDVHHNDFIVAYVWDKPTADGEPLLLTAEGKDINNVMATIAKRLKLYV